jgi:diacylglycerol kinase (ATP)
MHGTVHLFDRLPQVARPSAAPEGLAPPSRAVPLIGVIHNARSHRNHDAVPEATDRANLLVEIPERRKELAGILAQFAERRVDYIVVNGGDGTVRDVLTSGAGVFGESWPPLIVLPNGKTNALATDLGVPPSWALNEAVEAIHTGRIEQRRPLMVTQDDDADARVYGFVFGAGVFNAAIGLGQDAHRWGAFNSLAVIVTVGWSLLQAIFGSDRNIWRKGTPMIVRDAGGAEIPHAGDERKDQRYLLFASTLERFPAGLRPFGLVEGALRVSMIDSAKLALLLRLPLILRGYVSEGLRRRGYRAFNAEALQIDIGERFILDGEAFPPGHYRLSLGPKLRFVVP